MTPHDLPQPIACPGCGSLLTQQAPEASYTCGLGHDYSPVALEQALLGQLQQTLQSVEQRLQQRAWLVNRMQQQGQTTLAVELNELQHLTCHMLTELVSSAPQP